MTVYNVEMMSEKDYRQYMGGSYNYRVIDVEIKARSVENALQKVKALYHNYIINEKSVEVVRED